MTNKWDELIKNKCIELNLPFEWLWIKAQMQQESGFNEKAKSSCGAIGLLQIMPSTANMNAEELYAPEVNVKFGIKYLIEQYKHFPEIPEQVEKIRFALASYNGGRGYVNRALQLAREFENKTVKESGNWQLWEFTKEKLKLDTCQVRRKHPDWKQILDYVKLIEKYYNQLKEN